MIVHEIIMVSRVQLKIFKGYDNENVFGFQLGNYQGRGSYNNFDNRRVGDDYNSRGNGSGGFERRDFRRDDRGGFMSRDRGDDFNNRDNNRGGYEYRVRFQTKNGPFL